MQMIRHQLLCVLLLNLFACHLITLNALARGSETSGRAVGQRPTRLFRIRRQRRPQPYRPKFGASGSSDIRTNKILSDAQLQTENNLKNELTKLVRRPRWTPPSSASNPQFQSESVRYVQRTMQHLTATVETLSQSVQTLSNWKSTTELRLERIEAALSGASRRISDHRHAASTSQRGQENSDRIDAIQSTVAQLQRDLDDMQEAVERVTSSNEINGVVHGIQSLLHPQLDVSSVSQQNLRGGHPIDVMDEVRNQAARLDTHDLMLRKSSIDITSLQHHLMRIITKNERQDASIRFLQAVCTNSSAVNARSTSGAAFDVASMAQPTELKRIKDEISAQNGRIDGLQRTLDEAGTCCETVAVLASKTDMMSERIHEARNRADESALAVRVNNRKVDEMTNKMDMQRLVIKRLQQTILNHQRSASRLNRNMHESIRGRTSAINATLFQHVQTRVDELAQIDATELARLQSLVADNTNNLRATTDFVAQQIQQHVTMRFDVEKLQRDLREHVTNTAANDSRLAVRIDRVNSEAQSLAASARQDCLAHNVATENRVESAEDSIRRLQENERNGIPGQHDTIYESVIFLNSSYHQLRAAVQRQSNRYATLNSYVARLNQAEGRLWERITRLQENLDDHNFRANNASMSLRHTVTSDLSSLRRIVASRFQALVRNVGDLTSSYEKVSSDQELLSQTLTSYLLNSESAFTELNKQMNQVTGAQENLEQGQNTLGDRLDDILSSVNTSISELFLDRVEDITALDDHLQHQIGFLKLRTSVLERNITDHKERITHLQRRAARMQRSIGNTRATVLDVDNRMGTMEIEIADNRQKHLAAFGRLSAVDSSLKEYGQQIVANKMRIGILSQARESDRNAYASYKNSTRDAMKMLRRDHDALRDTHDHTRNELNRKFNRVTAQLTNFKSEVRQRHQSQDDRVAAVESINATLRAEILLCKDEVRQAENGISELRRVDSSLRDTIELNTRALTEHRKLHRNITTLSDSVYEVINEQGEALDTVRNVVVQLNETLAEGKEHIDDAVTTQIERHMREVRGVRFIMRNFTDIIQRVLSDRINQGVTMASVQINQRGLMESIDNHAASIARLNHDTARIRASVTSAEVVGEENTRRIGTLDMRLRSHDRSLHEFDRLNYEIYESMNNLSARISEQSTRSANLMTWMESDRSLLSNLAELATSLQQEFNGNSMSVWESINEIIQRLNVAEDNAVVQNGTLEALEMWSAEAQSSLVRMIDDANVLGTRMDLIVDAMGSISDLDRNVSEVARRVSELARLSSENRISTETLRDKTDEMQANVTALGTSLRTLERVHEAHALFSIEQLTGVHAALRAHTTNITALNGGLGDLESTFTTRLRNVSEATSGLLESFSGQRDAVDSLVNERGQSRRDIDYLLSTVDLNDLAISNLNSTAEELERRMNSLDHDLATSTTLIVSVAAEDRKTIEDLQTKQWDHDSRIAELGERTNVVEEQVSSIEARLSRRLSKPTVQIDPRIESKVRALESNLSDSRSRIATLEAERDSSRRVTKQLEGRVQENSLLIRILNDTESFTNVQVIASLVASISTLEVSLMEVNESLSYSFSNMDSLLTDFQLAFDTSGRMLERYRTDMNVMYLNISNQLDYFTTSIDILNRIAGETNEAVAENTQRIQLINQTAILTQFTVSEPYLNGHSQQNATSEYDGGDDDNYVVSENVDVGAPAPLKAAGGPGDYSIYGNEPDPFSDFNDYWSPISAELAAVLSGNADEERIHRRTASLFEDDYGEDYGGDDEDYDGDDVFLNS